MNYSDKFLDINKIKKLNYHIEKILIILLCVLLFQMLYVGISIYIFSHVDETTHADVAIVLGASIFGDKPSPVFTERINHGIWLYKNNYIKYLIFTCGKGKKNRNV
jgi:vancomycin permeability regulator SanA